VSVDKTTNLATIEFELESNRYQGQIKLTPEELDQVKEDVLVNDLNEGFKMGIRLLPAVYILTGAASLYIVKHWL
jgi:hypothetical protein